MSSNNAYDLFNNRCKNNVFNEEQLVVLQTAAERNIDPKKFQLLANPDLNADQMEILLYLGIEGSFSEEILDLVANPQFNVAKMRMLLFAFSNGLTLEQAQIFARPEFSAYQLRKLAQCFLDFQLSPRQVGFLANPELTVAQIDFSAMALWRGVPFNQVKRFVQPGFSSEQTKHLVTDIIYRGFSADEVSVYANPKLSSEQVDIIKSHYCAGGSIEDAKVLVQTMLAENKRVNSKKNIDNLIANAAVTVAQKQGLHKHNHDVNKSKQILNNKER